MRRTHVGLLLLVVGLGVALLWTVWPSSPASSEVSRIEPARSLAERQAERRSQQRARPLRSPSLPVDPTDPTAVALDRMQDDTGAEPTRLVLDVADEEGHAPERAYAVVRCEEDAFRQVAPLDEGRMEMEVPFDADCRVMAVRRDGLLTTRSDWLDFRAAEGDEIELEAWLPADRKGGIGISIAESDEGIVAVSVFPGTPAWEAGLRSGDVIVEVGDLPAAVLTIREFQDVMTGPEGSEVEFVLAPREGDTAGREHRVTATRAYLDPSLFM